MAEFRMPSLGADMDHGKVVEWLVKPGDYVHKGDLVAAVDTDKTVMDIESFEEGVFAMSIGFPTVPKGKARIRVMISAAHDNDDLGKGLDAFAKVGRKLGVIS